jgi:hypothetical protein
MQSVCAMFVPSLSEPVRLAGWSITGNHCWVVEQRTLLAERLIEGPKPDANQSVAEPPCEEEAPGATCGRSGAAVGNGLSETPPGVWLTHRKGRAREGGGGAFCFTLSTAVRQPLVFAELKHFHNRIQTPKYKLNLL